MSNLPTPIDLLELDIDIRMMQLWAEAASIKTWTIEEASIFMRAAYGKGYCDALAESERGQLCRDHGYRVPGVTA